MTKTTVLKVQGMTCGHCELSVQEALDELDGVQFAKADRETGDVEVAYDETRVGAERFKGAVEEAGYALAGGEER
jgi:copper chaperone